MITDFSAGMKIQSAIDSFANKLNVGITEQGIGGTGEPVVHAKVSIDSFEHLFELPEDINREELKLIGAVQPSSDGEVVYLNAGLFFRGNIVGNLSATYDNKAVYDCKLDNEKLGKITNE